MTITELVYIINNEDIYNVESNYSDIKDDYIEGNEYIKLFENYNLNYQIMFKSALCEYTVLKNNDIISVEVYDKYDKITYIKQFKIEGLV